MKFFDKLAFSYIPAAIAFCVNDIVSSKPLKNEEINEVLAEYAKGAGFPVRRITLRSNSELALVIGGGNAGLDALIIPLGYFEPADENKKALAA
jgi:hypothetical protein